MSEPVSGNQRILDPCQSVGRYRKKSVQDVQHQLQSMHDAVQETLGWEGRRAFWCQYWEFQVLHASDREYANRDLERWGRFAALILVLGVTALTSMSVFATGPSASWLGISSAVVAWLAAIATGALGLFRYGDRWSTHHTVRTGLMAAGWNYVNATTGEAPDREKAWSIFVEETQDVMATYEQRHTPLMKPHDNKHDR